MRKKLLSLLLCFSFLFSGMFIFSGCSQSELVDNTKTVIDQTTGIIPYEYSKELATSLYVSAYSKFYSVDGFKMTAVLTDSEGMVQQSVSNVSNDGKSISLALNNGQYVCQYIEDTFYQINKLAKTYSEIAASMVIDMLFTNFSFEKTIITGGMCYNGVSYVSFDGNWKQGEQTSVACGFATIVDGYITSVVFTTTYEGSTNAYNVSIDYENYSVDTFNSMQEMQDAGFTVV